MRGLRTKLALDALEKRTGLSLHGRPHEEYNEKHYYVPDRLVIAAGGDPSAYGTGITQGDEHFCHLPVEEIERLARPPYTVDELLEGIL